MSKAATRPASNIYRNDAHMQPAPSFSSGQIGESALIAVGANLGEAAEVVVAGVAALARALGAEAELSPLYRTPAFPAGSGPDFVNAACVLRGVTDASAILAACHRVEAAFGRERGARWGARVLDLDLLAVGDQIAPDAATLRAWIELAPAAQQSRVPEGLILPHPRLQDRGFVLVPLSDLAPDWVHPMLGQSVAQMRAALPARELAEIKRI